MLSGAAVAFASTGGFAGDASDPSDSAKTLTGAVLDQASAAAIAAAGGGTVTEAEEGDDGQGAYEVEVRLDDGTSSRSRSTRTSPCSARRPMTVTTGSPPTRVLRATTTARPPTDDGSHGPRRKASRRVPLLLRTYATGCPTIFRPVCGVCCSGPTEEVRPINVQTTWALAPMETV